MLFAYIKDKTIALGQNGNADTSSSGPSIESFFAPMRRVKRIMYIYRAGGNVM